MAVFKVGRKSRTLSRCFGVCLLGALSWLVSTPAAADEIIFLQDGSTIQADKTQVIGDRLRIHTPTEIIEVPRTDVLTIHEVTPSTTSPAPISPADVYRDITPQMNEKARQDTQQLLKPPKVFRR